MTPKRPADPAVLVATVGGIGLIPIAPGTWGSLAAVPAGWLIVNVLGVAGLLAAIVAIFALGVWASGRYAARAGEHDPGSCVIDEVVGQLIVVAALPPDPWFLAGGFVMFRLFDIIKPWPAGLVDQRVPGGLGIMLDDVVAGLQAAAVMMVIVAILEHGGLP
ncbi:MAG: phosphatidylglycerophosphatase A [Alphaproteobacteria bacterium]|nr:phosphatidylglycerophosphatase A [Alphaproteobacteria bacterium]